MNRDVLRGVRKQLRLSQAEFGQLIGAHAQTVSKWERGVLEPSAYQLALIERFKMAARASDVTAGSTVKRLLASSGAPEAIAWLLQAR
jgi:transcriptional regulator with XRE-family HTH domain